MNGIVPNDKDLLNMLPASRKEDFIKIAESKKKAIKDMSAVQLKRNANTMIDDAAITSAKNNVLEAWVVDSETKLMAKDVECDNLRKDVALRDDYIAQVEDKLKSNNIFDKDLQNAYELANNENKNMTKIVCNDDLRDRLAARALEVIKSFK